MAIVGVDASSLSPFFRTPCSEGDNEVNNEACEGAVCEDALKAFSKTTPRSARLVRKGAVALGYPYIGR